MDCPNCQKPMTPPGTYDDRYWCACGRLGVEGEAPEDIEIRERGRQEALALLDYAIAMRGGSRASSMRQEPDDMGQLIQTRGCGQCGGTMYKTVDTDDNGNPTNESQYVCNNCGNVE